MKSLSEVEARYYRKLADLYVKATGQTEYELSEVVRWAMGNGLLSSRTVTGDQVIENTRRLALRSEAEEN